MPSQKEKSNSIERVMNGKYGHNNEFNMLSNSEQIEKFTQTDTAKFMQGTKFNRTKAPKNFTA